MGKGWLRACSVFAALHFLCSASTHAPPSVEPPSNFQIVDPGLLGWMVMQWETPASLLNLSHCEVKYKLQYKSDEMNGWTTVLTRRCQYSDGFDLSKDIMARVRTLVTGPCTQEHEVWSDWIRVHLKPPVQGALESQIQNFHCQFHNWEHLICTWQAKPILASGINYELHYWYQGLPQALQCGEYIQSHDINVGCTFHYQKLEYYAKMFIRIAGYDRSASPRLSYYVIELQNIVKPVPPDIIRVTESLLPGANSGEALMEWTPPEGKVPPQCLEYEVLVTEDALTWKTLPIQIETTYTIYSLNNSVSLCARVRAKVNMFCADNGYWSEWSPAKCTEGSPESELKAHVGLFMSLGVLVLLLCVIALCCWIDIQKFCVKEKIIYSAA